MQNKRLENKVVLLTGISSGMGRVIARLFAEHGAIVVGCGQNVENTAETVRLVEEDGNAIDATAPVDLASRSDVTAWVEATIQKYGKIDVLFNNASHPRFGNFADMSDEDYHYTIRNEVDLVWIASNVAWPYLAKTKGTIVNIGSGAALLGARHLPQAAHAAAKGAINALTRQLAAEGVADGIRVNCINPGVMATPPVLGMYEQFGEKAPVHAIVERTISGQPGDPMAVAYAGLYFASDESEWVTGASLTVDGGASAYM